MLKFDVRSSGQMSELSSPAPTGTRFTLQPVDLRHRTWAPGTFVLEIERWCLEYLKSAQPWRICGEDPPSGGSGDTAIHGGENWSYVLVIACYMQEAMDSLLLFPFWLTELLGIDHLTG